MKIVLALLALAFPWIRFKFNQWGSVQEFNIRPRYRWYSEESVQHVTGILWQSLDDYRQLCDNFVHQYNAGQHNDQRMGQISQELDDAAHRYNSQVMLAQYFRSDSFCSFQEVQTSRQVLRTLRNRPIMPMGFVG